MDFKKNKILIGVFVVIAMFLAKIYVDMTEVKSEPKLSLESSNQISESDSKLLLEDEPEEIYVHVAGRVKSPGLVKLPSGSRVIDAVNACGGMFEDADMNNINLAKKLADEDRVYIPYVGEVAKSSGGEELSKININSATKEDLMKLPNVGEKTAQSIIKYREKTQFKKIEDIMNVPGIGEKTFESLEDSISV
ncbi:competence protein ComEA [Peptoniphilus asaccharolyticus DSM 20463]|uniref:Competence protein ComEA n=1 Tax=Peptoniphilus asaccharolyticus DSM 20463 TaxID=573058 RepID=A0A1W1UKW3_PEPAS|nr:helix-hairpin-helix domain-containing protein [Peptoniphilus asaccharolyticus]MBL7574853.1 helix-hairpin-helix domain-containing protein [Peptoniphilus asaccharolyticus]SMB81669.1 competence protein ComEA [Peptoniphilus asaccharolyticus DSM 20463]